MEPDGDEPGGEVVGSDGEFVVVVVVVATAWVVVGVALLRDGGERMVGLESTANRSTLSN